MMHPIKLCTIGCGRHSQVAHGAVQAELAERNPGLLQLAACCDLDAGLAAEYASRFGFARHYTNIDEMIRQERPDSICLVVPASAACQLGVKLLAKGIPLLMEKPPGLSSGELEALIAAAERSGCRHLVGFNRRFMPIITRACEILRGEEFSTPWKMNYELIRRNRRDIDFSTTAIHAIDAALFLANSPLTTAHAAYADYPELGSTVSSMHIRGECASGTRIDWTIHPAAGRVYERVTIHAVGHTLVLKLPIRSDKTPGLLTHWADDKLAMQKTFTPPHQIGFLQQTSAFLQALSRGEEPPPRPRLTDCRQSVALMEALRARKTTVEMR